MAYSTKNMMTVLLMAAMVALSACAQKDDSSPVRVANRSGVTSTNTTGIALNCTNGASAVGKVYDSGYSYGVTDYRPKVVNFLSAILTENYIGQISTSPYDKTGIDLVASFKFDASGVNLKASAFTMTIFDSLVGTLDSANGAVIPAYPVEFKQSHSGQILQNGQFTVKFKDEFGEITFTGTKTNQEYTYGKVSYVNNKNVNGGSPQSGTLGDFVIPTCGLFQ